MAFTSLSKQVVVFGRFDFPANTKTSLALLKAFEEFEFMPSVVRAIEMNRPGVATPQIMLTNEAGFRILFGSNRIDITDTKPTDVDLEKFVSMSLKLISSLPEVTAFSRVALVHDVMNGAVGSDDWLSYLEKFAPSIPKDSIEWTTRWVNKKAIDKETYVLSLDISRAVAIIQEDNLDRPTEVLKALIDVSTNNVDTSERFKLDNLRQIFEHLLLEQKQIHSTFSGA